MGIYSPIFINFSLDIFETKSSVVAVLCYSFTEHEMIYFKTITPLNHRKTQKRNKLKDKESWDVVCCYGDVEMVVKFSKGIVIDLASFFSQKNKICVCGMTELDIGFNTTNSLPHHHGTIT